MAIEAKLNFMDRLQMEIGSILTVTQVGKLMEVVKSILNGFDVNELLAEGNSNDDLVDCFISAKRVQGLAQSTLHRYALVIRKLIREARVRTGEITVHHLRRYISNQQESGLKDSTIEGERQVFSSFFNWLQRENLINRNPTANLGAIKTAKKIKKIFTESDIENMRRCCRRIRDRAILETLRSTGCRISEVMGLTREQVDLNNMQCLVHGKGNKERRVYLDPVAAMCIRNYLNSREDSEPWLFMGQKGRLTQSGVRYMLAEMEKISGVDHIHPHKFRRTLATELARRGMPIQEIARILGHEKIDTTMRYIVLNDDDVKHDYRRYA